MKVSVDDTSILESEGILHIDIAVKLSADICIVTYDISLDDRSASYHDLSLDLKGSFKSAVYAYVIR